MDDALEDMGVSAVGHPLEEVTFDDLAPRLDFRGGQVGLTSRNDVLLIEQNSICGRISLEYRDKQRPATSPNVKNRPERREVIGRHDLARSLGSALVYSCDEVLALFGLLRTAFPLTHAKDVVERGLAGHRTVEQSAPCAGGFLPAKHRVAAKRARPVSLQECPE